MGDYWLWGRGIGAPMYLVVSFHTQRLIESSGEESNLHTVEVGIKARFPTPQFSFLSLQVTVGRGGVLGCNESLEVEKLTPAGWWEGEERGWWVGLGEFEYHFF